MLRELINTAENDTDDDGNAKTFLTTRLSASAIMQLVKQLHDHNALKPDALGKISGAIGYLTSLQCLTYHTIDMRFSAEYIANHAHSCSIESLIDFLSGCAALARQNHLKYPLTVKNINPLLDALSKRNITQHARAIPYMLYSLTNLMQALSIANTDSLDIGALEKILSNLLTANPTTRQVANTLDALAAISSQVESSITIHLAPLVDALAGVATQSKTLLATIDFISATDITQAVLLAKDIAQALLGVGQIIRARPYLYADVEHSALSALVDKLQACLFTIAQATPPSRQLAKFIISGLYGTALIGKSTPTKTTDALVEAAFKQLAALRNGYKEHEKTEFDSLCSQLATYLFISSKDESTWPAWLRETINAQKLPKDKLHPLQLELANKLAEPGSGFSGVETEKKFDYTYGDVYAEKNGKRLLFEINDPFAHNNAQKRLKDSFRENVLRFRKVVDWVRPINLWQETFDLSKEIRNANTQVKELEKQKDETKSASFTKPLQLYQCIDQCMGIRKAPPKVATTPKVSAAPTLPEKIIVSPPPVTQSSQLPAQTQEIKEEVKEVKKIKPTTVTHQTKTASKQKKHGKNKSGKKIVSSPLVKQQTIQTEKPTVIDQDAKNVLRIEDRNKIVTTTNVASNNLSVEDKKPQNTKIADKKSATGVPQEIVQVDELIAELVPFFQSISLEKLFILAETSPTAQLFLGIRYLCEKQNMRQAALWLEKAAAQGNVLANYLLGLYYQEGELVKKDVKKSIQYFTYAAKHGLVQAQHELADYYAHGKFGVDKDPSLAFKWTQQLAAQGDALGQANLGSFYFLGRGVEKNIPLAFYWYQKAAIQGIASAQASLGVFYEKGWNIPEDKGKAFYWYQQAAEQGNATGQLNLAFCYANGWGVKKDLTQAVELFEKSANQGNSEAQHRLAICYYMGLGKTKDLVQSERWYLAAAIQGHTKAQHNIGLFYSQQRRQSEALTWFQAASAQNFPPAKEMLEKLGVTVKKSASDDTENGTKIMGLSHLTSNV